MGMPTFLNELVPSIDYRLTFSSNGSGSPHVEAVTITYGMESTPSDVVLKVGDTEVWNGKGEIPSPLRTDDLANAMNAYLKKERTGNEGPDDNILVPVMLSSGTPGTVTVSKVLLDIALPPSIDAAVPTDTEVDMEEGSTATFQVTATEPDERPLTYNWSLDGKPVPGAGGISFEHVFDYNSSGTHTVDVTVSNGNINVTRQWDVTVREVNRPPEISAISPQGTVYAREEELVPFDVTASDPDGGPVSYSWYLDDVVLKGQDSNFLDLTPEAGSAGQHILTVEVSDGTDAATFNWTVKVDAPSKDGDGNGMDYRLPLAAIVIIALIVIIAMELHLSRQRGSRRKEREARQASVEQDKEQGKEGDEAENADEVPAPVVRKKIKKVTKKRMKRQG